MAIGNVSECRSAEVVAIIGGTLAKNEENDMEWPKGCYLAKSGLIWWNDHDTGSPHNNARQICIGGMYVWVLSPSNFY